MFSSSEPYQTQVSPLELPVNPAVLLKTEYSCPIHTGMSTLYLSGGVPKGFSRVDRTARGCINSQLGQSKALIVTQKKRCLPIILPAQSPKSLSQPHSLKEAQIFPDVPTVQALLRHWPHQSQVGVGKGYCHTQRHSLWKYGSQGRGGGKMATKVSPREGNYGQA